jgi:hypothetical protein
VDDSGCDGGDSEWVALVASIAVDFPRVFGSWVDLGSQLEEKKNAAGADAAERGGEELRSQGKSGQRKITRKATRGESAAGLRVHAMFHAPSMMPVYLVPRTCADVSIMTHFRKRPTTAWTWNIGQTIRRQPSSFLTALKH